MAPFPPPSTFSLLPDIYQLLSRLDLLQQSSSEEDDDEEGVTTATTTLLKPKDLPYQLHGIRRKIAEARDAVRGLADVKRDETAQEVEMRQLQARVTALTARIRQLGRLAGMGVEGKEDEDVVMTSVEEG